MKNFAIAAAEALAYGVPCILSSNVALASIVTEHSAGVVFEELDPHEIEKAISKVSTLDKQVSKNAALLAASDLSWEKIAKQWESTIETILQE